MAKFEVIWFDTLASDQSLPSLNVLHTNFKQFGLRLKFETCLSEVLDRSRSTVRSVRLQDRSGAGILQVSCIASMMMMNKVAQCANVLRYVTSIFSSQLGWVLVNDNRCMEYTG